MAEDTRHLLDEQQWPGVGQWVGKDDLTPELVSAAPEILPGRRLGLTGLGQGLPFPAQRLPARGRFDQVEASGLQVPDQLVASVQGQFNGGGVTRRGAFGAQAILFAPVLLEDRLLDRCRVQCQRRGWNAPEGGQQAQSTQGRSPGP